MQSLPPVDLLLVDLAAFANVIDIVTASDVNWDWRPSLDDWNLVEVICHLRDVEREVHQPRFHSMMASDNPFLSGASTDHWVQTRNYAAQDGAAAAASYLVARSETLEMLPAADSDLWQRTARHAYLGPTSMHELLHLIVRHDQAHLPQLTALRYHNDDPIV